MSKLVRRADDKHSGQAAALNAIQRIADAEAERDRAIKERDKARQLAKSQSSVHKTAPTRTEPIGRVLGRHHFKTGSHTSRAVVGDWAQARGLRELVYTGRSTGQIAIPNGKQCVIIKCVKNPGWGWYCIAPRWLSPGVPIYINIVPAQYSPQNRVEGVANGDNSPYQYRPKVCPAFGINVGKIFTQPIIQPENGLDPWTSITDPSLYTPIEWNLIQFDKDPFNFESPYNNTMSHPEGFLTWDQACAQAVNAPEYWDPPPAGDRPPIAVFNSLLPVGNKDIGQMYITPTASTTRLQVDVANFSIATVRVATTGTSPSVFGDDQGLLPECTMEEEGFIFPLSDLFFGSGAVDPAGITGKALSNAGQPIVQTGGASSASQIYTFVSRNTMAKPCIAGSSQVYNRPPPYINPDTGKYNDINGIYLYPPFYAGRYDTVWATMDPDGTTQVVTADVAATAVAGEVRPIYMPSQIVPAVNDNLVFVPANVMACSPPLFCGLDRCVDREYKPPKFFTAEPGSMQPGGPPYAYEAELLPWQSSFGQDIIAAHADAVICIENVSGLSGADVVITYSNQTNYSVFVGSKHPLYGIAQKPIMVDDPFDDAPTAYFGVGRDTANSVSALATTIALRDDFAPHTLEVAAQVGHNPFSLNNVVTGLSTPSLVTPEGIRAGTDTVVSKLQDTGASLVDRAKSAGTDIVGKLANTGVGIAKDLLGKATEAGKKAVSDAVARFTDDAVETLFGAL